MIKSLIFCKLFILYTNGYYNHVFKSTLYNISFPVTETSCQTQSSELYNSTATYYISKILFEKITPIRI